MNAKVWDRLKAVSRRLQAAHFVLLFGLQFACDAGPPALNSVEAAQTLCTDLICEARWLPPQPGDEIPFGNFIRGDRDVYRATDGVAQFAGAFYGVATAALQAPGSSLRIRVESQAGAVLGEHVLMPPLSRKFTFQIGLGNLTPAGYVSRVTLRGASGDVATVVASFQMSGVVDTTASFPLEGIAILPHVLPGALSSPYSLPISTGVPLPRGALTDADLAYLSVEDDNVPIRASFEVRARWSPNGPIKWLGVNFTSRWKNAQPNAYRLRRRSTIPSPSGPSVVLSENAGEYIVTNGPLRIVIAKPSFTGLREVYYDTNGDGQYSANERVVDGKSGPYVVDEAGQVYTAAWSDAPVVIEESSPYRLVLLAEGEYRSNDGDGFCRFVVRMTIVAGQPFVDVDHRTIVTYDTSGPRRIADVGFGVAVVNSAAQQWAVGTDAQPVAGSSDEVFVHQESGTTFHVTDGSGVVGSGQVAPGWLHRGDSTRPGIAIAMRDFRRKFPKEIGATSNSPIIGLGDGAPVLLSHAWPRHGHPVFGADATNVSQLHKMRWVHEGPLLDFRVPATYLSAFAPHMPMPDNDHQVENAAASNAQGIVVAQRFAVYFTAPTQAIGGIGGWAQLYDLAPHALAEPAWNASSQALGLLSAASTVGDRGPERAMELAYPQYQRAVMEGLDEFGMWVYGNTHDKWNPASNRPEMHRVWLNSHYQSVWTALMLYFRSGRADDYRFARARSENFLDIGTTNWGPDGSRVPVHVRGAGAMYHGKGYVPWSDTNSYVDHWIDAEAHLLSYYLFGDKRARDMYEAWRRGLHETGATPAMPSGTTCAAFAPTSMREQVTAVGEIATAYQASWDPETLLMLGVHDAALELYDWRCTQSPHSYPVWHSRWFSTYHTLTRRSWVVQRLAEWFDSRPGDVAAAAYLAYATGDNSYLARGEAMGPFYDKSVEYYDNVGDQYHGYGRWYAAVHDRFLQSAPYYTAALQRAGLPLLRSSIRVGYPSFDAAGSGVFSNGVPQPQPHHRNRGWAPSSQFVYIARESSVAAPWNVSLERMPGFDVSDGAVVFARSSIAKQLPRYFAGPGTFDYATGDAVISALRYGASTALWASGTTTSTATLHHVETMSAGGAPFYSPYYRGTEPVSEAMVLQRWFYRDGCNFQQKEYLARERTDFAIMPVFPQTSDPTLRLRFRGALGKNNVPSAAADAGPTYVRLEDQLGSIVFEASLFAYGQRQEAIAELPVDGDGDGVGDVYRLYSSGVYGPRIALVGGAAELLLGDSRPSLQSVMTRMTRYPSPMPSQFTVGGAAYPNPSPVCP